MEPVSRRSLEIAHRRARQPGNCCNSWLTLSRLRSGADTLSGERRHWCGCKLIRITGSSSKYSVELRRPRVAGVDVARVSRSQGDGGVVTAHADRVGSAGRPRRQVRRNEVASGTGRGRSSRRLRLLCSNCDVDALSIGRTCGRRTATRDAAKGEHHDRGKDTEDDDDDKKFDKGESSLTV